MKTDFIIKCTSKFHHKFQLSTHPCVKNVQIRSFFWSVFSAFGLNRRDTPYLSVFNLNAGKYGPEKTPYLDTFHAVHASILRHVLRNKNNRYHVFMWMLTSFFFWETSRTSKTELFAKVVNSFQPVTIFAKRSILDVWLGSEDALYLRRFRRFIRHFIL